MSNENKKTGDKIIDLGQVFTPKYIVELILDRVGYVGTDVLASKILEPSFGEGVFLEEIVVRIITEGKNAGLDNVEIQRMLNDNIYGVEIDETLYNFAKDRINKVLLENKMSKIPWDNLHLGNTLTYNTDVMFDYVVGNPPYIRVHNLDDNIREVFKTFKFSEGTTDMYILFFEKAIGLLGEQGKLGFITPNSFMKNTSQEAFRKHLLSENIIKEVIDFKSYLVFDNIMTYTAISIIDNDKDDEVIKYSEFVKNVCSFTNTIDIESMAGFGAPWSFSTEDDNKLIDDIDSRSTKISDLCLPQNGLATLRDKIFISKVEEADNIDDFVFNGVDVEKGLLKPIVKASTYREGSEPLYILFPYYWCDDEDNYVVLGEQYLRSTYPKAYDYLLDNKEELLKRDLDKGAQWYQLGRSQGLKNSKNNKLVIKTMFNASLDNLEVYEFGDNVFVYSGIYITSDSDEYLKVVKAALESEDFFRYAKIVGKDMRSGWKSISSKNIRNYGIEESLISELRENKEDN